MALGASYFCLALCCEGIATECSSSATTFVDCLDLLQFEVLAPTHASSTQILGKLNGQTRDRVPSVKPLCDRHTPNKSGPGSAFQMIRAQVQKAGSTTCIGPYTWTWTTSRHNQTLHVASFWTYSSKVRSTKAIPSKPSSISIYLRAYLEYQLK